MIPSDHSKDIFALILPNQFATRLFLLVVAVTAFLTVVPSPIKAADPDTNRFRLGPTL